MTMRHAGPHPPLRTTLPAPDLSTLERVARSAAEAALLPVRGFLARRVREDAGRGWRALLPDDGE